MENLKKVGVLKLSMPEIMGKTEVLINKTLIIGRSADDCQIVFPQKNISRKHAKVTFSNDKYLIEDLGSHNGTLLNGRIARKEILQSDDTIQIGDIKMTFVLKELVDQNSGETQEVGLTNEDLGPGAADSTSFIDLTELNAEELEMLRKEKPSITDPWEEI